MVFIDKLWITLHKSACVILGDVWRKFILGTVLLLMTSEEAAGGEGCGFPDFPAIIIQHLVAATSLQPTALLFMVKETSSNSSCKTPSSGRESL